MTIPLICGILCVYNICAVLRMGKDGAYQEARDFIPTSIIVGVGAAAGGGSTHTVLVLADEDGGEIPQLGLEFMSNGGEKGY